MSDLNALAPSSDHTDVVPPLATPARFQRIAVLSARMMFAVFVCASALGILGYIVTKAASRERIFQRAHEAPPREVAIVLGAQVYRDGTLSQIVADRVACGAELFHQGRVRAVLVSGDHGRVHYDEVSAMGAALLRAGLPRSRVFLDHAGFRTLDTMQRARKVFGVQNAVICTQRFHLPRSIYLAKSFGIDAVGVIADRRRYRSELFNDLRESIARAVSVLDVTFGREAFVLGAPVSLRGDARVTHDRAL